MRLIEDSFFLGTTSLSLFFTEKIIFGGILEQNHILGETQPNSQLILFFFFLPEKLFYPLIIIFEKENNLFPKRNEVRKNKAKKIIHIY